MKKPLRERSPLVYVLVALIPYSKPNMLLAYKPNQFFNELEKISRYKQSTLKAAYRRAQEQGLIQQRKNLIALTAKGKQKVAPFVAKDLKGAHLMVIFDIPEDLRSKRRQLRHTLQSWGFKKIQQSAWMTTRDYREELKDLISELDINKYVEYYECVRQFPK